MLLYQTLWIWSSTLLFATRSIVIVAVGTDYDTNSDSDNEKKSLRIRRRETSVDIYEEMQKLSGNTSSITSGNKIDYIPQYELLNSTNTISKPIPIPKLTHYGYSYN